MDRQREARTREPVDVPRTILFYKNYKKNWLKKVFPARHNHLWISKRN